MAKPLSIFPKRSDWRVDDLFGAIRQYVQLVANDPAATESTRLAIENNLKQEIERLYNEIDRAYLRHYVANTPAA